VRTEPLEITGLAGPVVVTMNSFTGKHMVTVGSHQAVGTRRGHYTFPTVDGRTVAARLRSSLLDPYPTIEISGVKHRTGPSFPVVLRMLALVPLAVLIYAGGLIGGAIGGGAIGVNLAIGRTKRSTAAKAMLMIGVLVAAFVVWTIVALALQLALY
jgi:hypothetical protein